MTNFDVITSKGPECVAKLFTDCKIRAMEMVCDKFGVLYRVPDKLREDIYKEHLEYLLREVET